MSAPPQHTESMQADSGEHRDLGFAGHPAARRGRGANVAVPVLVMLLAIVSVAVAQRHWRPIPGSDDVCLVADAGAVVPDTGVLFGVNLDWKSESLAEHRANLGHAPAVTVQFTDIPYADDTWESTTNAIKQVKENGGVLLLTLEPHAGLDAISADVIDRLARDLLDLNTHGVPVVLRFAHEMNGSWYSWGQQPEKYKAVFRSVARAVHLAAPGTSMMWAPNYGGGYPFQNGRFAALPGSADFTVLDTNHDGVVSMSDDSYGPYYPGAEYVDWVGVSLYHWGNTVPWGNNDITEPDKLRNMLTGTYNGTAGNDTGVPDFYQTYGVDQGHPVAIVETAALFAPSRSGEGELAVKQAWWRQVFADDLPRRFPQVKMINWFEWKKFEVEIADWVDWRAAGAPAIRDAFVADLPDWTNYAESVNACS